MFAVIYFCVVVSLSPSDEDGAQESPTFATPKSQIPPARTPRISIFFIYLFALQTCFLLFTSTFQTAEKSPGKSAVVSDDSLSGL